MSVKETTNLRKSGKLAEAYTMAVAELEQNPNDAWIQMSMFWVLRDLCQKIYIPQHDDVKLEKALHWMKSLLPTMMDNKGIGEKAFAALSRYACKHAEEISQALELSKSDPETAYNRVSCFISQPTSIDISLHESLGWILYRYLKKENERLTLENIHSLLSNYMALSNGRPSMLHSSMLYIALTILKNHKDFDFYHFFMTWGPEKLRPEDFKGGQIDGKTIQPFIARICRVMVENGVCVDIDDLLNKTADRKAQVLEHFRESYYWHFMNMQKEGKLHDMYESMGEYANRFSLYGPSLWHSKILGLAERFMVEQEEYRFLYFFKLWDYANLTPADWKENTDDKGNTYKSLAVKSAKKCFDVLKNQQSKKKEWIEWLLDLYKLVVEHDDDEWNMRKYAMLHIWIGNIDKAVSIYRGLLLKMSEKFYIWSELASCVHNDIPLKTALLCKALMVERDEKFLGDIHLHLAELLILQNLKEEASRELAIYRINREKESWSLSPLYHRLVADVGQIEGTEVTNESIYKEFISKAEEYAFAEIEDRIFVLVDKLTKDGKTRCVFADGKGSSFQVNARRFEGINKARYGTAYAVKCIEDKNSHEVSSHIARLKPVVMKPVEGELWASFPQKIGYISYVNSEKHTISVITPDSTLFIHSYTDRESYRKGDFLSFHEYVSVYKGEKKQRMVGIHRCKPVEALQQFLSCLVVVDSVNSSKSLFHYVSYVDGVEGVIFFSDTTLRPKEGQILHLSYCFRKNKEGKRVCEPVKVSRTDETSNRLVRSVFGELSIHSSSKGSFGFVDDCYVPNTLLKESSYYEGEEVTAEAVYSGNGKWKVIRWD